MGPPPGTGGSANVTNPAVNRGAQISGHAGNVLVVLGVAGEVYNIAKDPLLTPNPYYGQMGNTEEERKLRYWEFLSFDEPYAQMLDAALVKVMDGTFGNGTYSGTTLLFRFAKQNETKD